MEMSDLGLDRPPSCQLTITWTFLRMSTINLNTPCICLLASNARSLQGNNQSERAYYCSHIIGVRIRNGAQR